MAAKVKCPVCEERFDREEGKKVKSRWYHIACLKEKQESNKLKADNPDKVETKSQGESQDYKDLIEYVCDKYETKSPSPQILKQIKEYKNTYGFTYKGMELALRFFYDTEGNSVKEDTGIGIVIYVYEKAKNFYIKKLHVKKSVEDEADETRTFKTRGKNSHRGRRQIDINDL